MTSPHFARWQQATRNSHGPRPGARALMTAMLARYPGTRSMGIYSFRPTALGNPSAHGEGRALDIGCSRQLGHRIVDELLTAPYRNADGELRHGPAGLGISVLIHDGRIYSAKTPHGRPYAGDPHRDHVHVEMTRKAAEHLSLARARRVLAGG